jgi:hypothetical protein
MRLVQIAVGIISIACICAGGRVMAQEKMCTQEAKQCPDGSFVSRTLPDCGFALCPMEDNGSFVIDENARDMLASEKYPADKYDLNVHMIMPAYKEMESLEQVAKNRDTLKEQIIALAKERGVEIVFYEYAGVKAGFPDILIKCPDDFFKEIERMHLFGRASYPLKEGVALRPLHVSGQ